MITFRKRGKVYYVRGVVRLGRNRFHIPEMKVASRTEGECERLVLHMRRLVEAGILRGDGEAMISYRLSRVPDLLFGEPIRRRVYAVFAEQLCLVKIGIAEDVNTRLRMLRTGSADILHLVASIPGDEALERELHAKFKAHHAHREWFRVGPEVAAFLVEHGDSSLMPAGLIALLQSHRTHESSVEPAQDCSTHRSSEETRHPSPPRPQPPA